MLVRMWTQKLPGLETSPRVGGIKPATESGEVCRRDQVTSRMLLNCGVGEDTAKRPPFLLSCLLRSSEYLASCPWEPCPIHLLGELYVHELYHSKVTMFLKGHPSGSAGKESACNVADQGSIPRLGRSPREGNGYPLQCSGLENSMDHIVHGVAELDTTERLSLTHSLTQPKTWGAWAPSTDAGQAWPVASSTGRSSQVAINSLWVHIECSLITDFFQIILVKEELILLF